MSRSHFFWGAVLGAAVGLAVSYLFGPAHDTAFDTRYRSRLDRALEEARRAEQETAAALRRRFEEARGRGG